MDPDLQALIGLLNSGSNFATLVIVWLGFKIKHAFDSYVKSINAKLDALLEDNAHARRHRTARH